MKKHVPFVIAMLLGYAFGACDNQQKNRITINRSDAAAPATDSATSGVDQTAGESITSQEIEAVINDVLDALGGNAGDRMGDTGAEIPDPELQLYVALDGDDANKGALSSPLRTLEGARDAIRQLKSAGMIPSEGVRVNLREGDYYLTSTFRLSGDADSGSASAPIVYRAYRGEKVRLKGSKKLDVTKFQTVSDPAIIARLTDEARGSLQVLDLKQQGIQDYGSIIGYGSVLGDTKLSPLATELYYNSEPMTLGRWPNSGWTRVGEVPNNNTSDWMKRNEFPYIGDRPARWGNAVDFWAHGFLYTSYADVRIKLASVDTTRRFVTIAAGSERPVATNDRLYYFNLLEEIDVPGEYYIDRVADKLYFLPIGDLTGGTTELSFLTGPLIEMKNTAYVSIEGVTLEMVRGNAIEITGGNSNTIRGCTIRNVGKVGVVIGGDENPYDLEGPMSPYAYYGVETSVVLFPNTGVEPFDGGTNNKVIGCDIANVGTAGVALTGGDRSTLTPGNNAVEDNQITNFSRYKWAYEPAINLGGSGNRIAHNLIYNGPSQAILFRGNDQVIEYNEITNVLLESNDAGAIYSWATWSSRGNEIRYNYLHHLYKRVNSAANDVVAIYFDDFFGSAKVYGNVLHYTPGGSVFINGGRDFEVYDNIFVNGRPGQQAVFVNDRSNGQGPNVAAGWLSGNELKRFNYQSSPWKDRYPQLSTIFDDEPSYAKHNKLTNNLLVRSYGIGIHPNLTALSFDNIVSNNYETQDNPGFVNLAGCDFTLRSDSVALVSLPALKNLDFAMVGLLDKSRSKLPLQSCLEQAWRTRTTFPSDDFEGYELDSKYVPYWDVWSSITPERKRNAAVALDPTNPANKMFKLRAENINWNGDVTTGGALSTDLSSKTMTSINLVYDQLAPGGNINLKLSDSQSLVLYADGTAGFMGYLNGAIQPTLVSGFTHRPNQRYAIQIVLDTIAKKASLFINQQQLISDQDISNVLSNMVSRGIVDLSASSVTVSLGVTVPNGARTAPNNVSSVYFEDFKVIGQ